MNNRNTLCVSTPLMKEIFRMHWYIPVITFVLYFFTGIAPILSNISDVEQISYYIETCMRNYNVGFVAIMTFLPVLTATLMMGFLHRENKALMIHSLPLSKMRIFNSYYMSGWIICMLPLVLLILSYMLVAIKVPQIECSEVIQFAFSSISVMTLFYGLTVLAGTLTGTVVMNLLSAGVMSIILPAIVLIASGYCEIFITGYSEMPDSIIRFAGRSNPVISLLVGYNAGETGICAIYLAAGIVLSVCAACIYRTRKLELVGTSTLSKMFEEVMTYLVVFVGMSSFGLVMNLFGSSKPLVLAAMLTGMAVTLIIVKIIVNKTVRLDKKDLLRSATVCLAITLIFAAVTMFDVSGFDSRVPDADEIESIEMGNFITGYDDAYISYEAVPGQFTNYERTLTSPETIAKMLALHQYIVDNKLYLEKEAGDYEIPVLNGSDGSENAVMNEYVAFTYNLKNGTRMKRQFDITLTKDAAQMINSILKSEEYQQKTKLEDYLKTNMITHIRLENWASDGENNGVALVENPEQIKAFLEAWDRDWASYGYTDNNREYSSSSTLAYVDIFMETPEKDPNKRDSYQISLFVSEINANMIAWFKANGYEEILEAE